MVKTATVLQSALLLCVWGALAQEFMSPNVNIIEELGKLKNMEERLRTVEERQKTMEERLQNKSRSEEQLQKENEALKTTVETMKAKLESLQSIKEGEPEQSQESRQVAFSASLLASGSGHTGPFRSVTSLIYKKVSANFGNGYDSNTGIFTAPLKGVYYFRFYAHSHANLGMAVSLYKNDEVKCSVFSSKPVSNGNASNGIVLILDKGDQISTKMRANSWVYDSSGGFTSFGGFLLFPL